MGGAAAAVHRLHSSAKPHTVAARQRRHRRRRRHYRRFARQALAEATALPPAEAEVNNNVQGAVLARLRGIYSPHAKGNYQQLADQFTTTADRLTDAMTVCDPDASPEDIVNATAKVRTAWSEAQQLALQLTAQMPALHAAANLAGITVNTPEQLLALVVHADGAHRRRVWEAWDTTDGRTGRWGARIRLGSTIRAANLDHLEPTRNPDPSRNGGNK
jgi:hypothetical protein